MTKWLLHGEIPGFAHNPRNCARHIPQIPAPRHLGDFPEGNEYEPRKDLNVRGLHLRNPEEYQKRIQKDAEAIIAVRAKEKLEAENRLLNSRMIQ